MSTNWIVLGCEKGIDGNWNAWYKLATNINILVRENGVIKISEVTNNILSYCHLALPI